MKNSPVPDSISSDSKSLKTLFALIRIEVDALKLKLVSIQI